MQGVSSTEGATGLKIYVVTDDSGYVRKLQKKLSRSNIVIIEIDPKDAHEKIKYLPDADILLIDMIGLIDFNKDYYIPALLTLFYNYKIVLMTNRYIENALPDSIKNRVFGYIYKTAKSSIIVTTFFEIAAGERCYLRPEQWSLRIFWSYCAYLYNEYILKFHRKTEAH